jgi:hypothetical protein
LEGIVRGGAKEIIGGFMKTAILVLFFLLLPLFVFSGGNSETKDESVSTQTIAQRSAEQPAFTLANGTGAIITEIEIKPSQKKYKGNKNVYALQNITLQDQSSLAIKLPSEMKVMDCFDITVKYGKKVAKTRKSVTVEISNKVPLLVFSIKGKDSTVPLISAAGGGGAVAAGIGTGLAITTAAYGAGGFTYYMALIGSVVGGGMVAGATIVAAVPLAVGGGIFAGVMLLRADDLIVTNIDYAIP